VLDHVTEAAMQDTTPFFFLLKKKLPTFQMQFLT
jgi:hypothetical protein